MIHARLTDGHNTFKRADFATAEEFEEAVATAIESTGGNLAWESPQIGYCEFCNHCYDTSKVFLGHVRRWGTQGFCSDDCRREAYAEHDQHHREYDTDLDRSPDSDQHDREAMSY